MKLNLRIVILTLVVVLSTSIQAQQADKEMLRQFAMNTIRDHFIDNSFEGEKVFILPFVKNHEDSTLFDLKQNNLDSNLFSITTEEEVEELKDIKFPISLYSVKIIGSTNDTILVNIEEYQIEFKNYLLFKKPIRYFVCEGRGEHFTDGTFILDQKSDKWTFISGREKKIEWRKELFK